MVVGNFQLAGSVRTVGAGSVTRVLTLLNVCTESGHCARDSTFTSHTLTTPIPVAANQIIEVRVIFSFS
jgi:hypothetical protein